ncbi:hypothetical protein C8R47DRAFT_1090103, partial [Mycena vitilis]
MWTSLVSASVSVYSSFNTSSIAKSPCSSAFPDGDDDEGNTTLVADDSQGQGRDKESCATASSPSPAYYTISPSTSVIIEPFALSHSTSIDSYLNLLSELITATDLDLDFNIDFSLDDFDLGFSPSTDLAAEPAFDLSVYAPVPLSTASVPVQGVAPAANDIDLDLAQPAVLLDEVTPIVPEPALDLSVVVYVTSPFSTAILLASIAPAAAGLDLDLSDRVPSDLSTVSFVPSTTPMLVQEPDLAPAPDNLALDLSAQISSDLATIASAVLDPPSAPSVEPSLPSTETVLALVPETVLAPAADVLDLDPDLSQPAAIPAANPDLSPSDLAMIAPKALNPAVAIFVPRSSLSHDTAPEFNAHGQKDGEPPRALSFPSTRGGQRTQTAAPRPATLTASVPEFIPRFALGATIPSDAPGETHYRLTPHRSTAPNYWASRPSRGGPLSIVSPSPTSA